MDDTPSEFVVRALADLGDPPGTIETVVDEGSWYSVVTARDRVVLWRFVWEKGVWRLEAAPTWSPMDSFDADLLARHFLGRSLADSRASLGGLTRITPANLVEELRIVRGPVTESFREDNWLVLRSALVQEGRRRDHELLGRPIRPEGAA